MTLLMTAAVLDVVRSVVPEQITVSPVEHTEKIEGTGALVVEVLDAGPWGRPGTSRFAKRTVQVNVLADGTRTDTTVSDDADRRGMALWVDIDAVLHDVDHLLPFSTCLRISGPDVIPIPDADRCVLVTARYETSD